MDNTKTFFKAKEFNNIKDIIYNSADIYADNIAFTIKNKNGDEISYKDITYKQFLDDVNSLGTALYSLNMNDKRVAIVGKNRYEWILAYYANLLGSIVSVPLDKDLQLEELENSLIRSNAKAIVFDNKLLDLVENIKKRGNTNLKEYICMEKIDNYKSIPELVEKRKRNIKKW